MCKSRMVHVCTYHPPIHFIALTAIPVLSAVLSMPSLYYTSYNSNTFTSSTLSAIAGIRQRSKQCVLFKTQKSVILTEMLKYVLQDLFCLLFEEQNAAKKHRNYRLC